MKEIKLITILSIFFLTNCLFISIFENDAFAQVIHNQEFKTLSFQKSGDTLYVGGSGPGNYSSIQDAIEDANAGDTIFIYSGNYNEDIYIDKSIELIGENKENTIINGNFEFESDFVKVRGLKIKFGYLHHGHSNCLISDNIIQGGLTMLGSRHYTFSNNIFQSELALLRCDNISIVNNTMARIYLDSSSNNLLKGNKIVNKKSNDDIRCLETYHESANNIIVENTIANIESQDSIFVVFFSGNNEKADKIMFERNIITNISGNCVFTITTDKIKNISIRENIISDISSGCNLNSFAYGVLLYDTINIEIEKNIIDNTEGGIQLQYCSNSIIKDNTISNTKKNWFSFEKTGIGLLLLESTYVNIISNRFKNNYKHADFEFFHNLEQGETIPPGDLPDSYKQIRNEKDLSNIWDNNYWGHPKNSKKVIKGTLEVQDYYGNSRILTLENYDYNPQSISIINTPSLKILGICQNFFSILQYFHKNLLL